MKNYLGLISLSAVAFTITLMSGVRVLACDASIAKFSRDCAIQDRYEVVKHKLKKLNVDINEIAEYRVIRFIERTPWEKAKVRATNITQIYKPAPETWEVWDHGIRVIFGTEDFKGALLTAFNLAPSTIAAMNNILLTNGAISIKDTKLTDRSLSPGQYRKAESNPIGYCAPADNDEAHAIPRADASMARFQSRWENAFGKSFQEVVEEAHGINAFEQPIFETGMSVQKRKCDPYDQRRHYVNYAASNEVAKRMRWIHLFIDTNVKLFAEDKAVISPVEFAAFVQKWLITTHPFADGNGRTSRAVEDVLLAHLGMPFAPSGDLQDDASSDLESYTELTYQKMEQTLVKLEQCSDEIVQQKVAFQCRTVKQIITSSPN